jgi:hypothetical protein
VRQPESTPEQEPDGPILRSTRLPAATSSLRSSLAEQEARASELREALDALRATLDGRASSADPRAPVAQAPGPRHAGVRRLVLVGAVVVALVAVGVVVRQVAPPPNRQAAPGPAPEPVTSMPPPATTAPPSASGGLGTRSTPASASSPSPSASRTTRPLPWPGGAVLTPPGLPAGGPGATAPGLEATAALDPDGAHVDVYERLVLLPGSATFLLSQATLTALPPVLRRARPVVEDLQVELDGRPVQPVPIPPAGSAWRVSVPDGAAAVRAVLRYRLATAFVRQTPAPPGRLTLVLRPLGAAVVLARRDPVVVRITDPRVGILSCPTASRPLCGSAAGATRTAALPAGATAVVLAQVTLR